MRKTKQLFFVLFVGLFFINLQGFSQYDIPEKPSFIPALIDSAKVLNQAQFNALSHKLEKYSDSTSTEMFVMIRKSLYGAEVSSYATELGHKWEIGQKGKDNGIVILVAIDDRKVRISAGYGVEHLLTDALTSRIYRNIIVPNFKQQNYYQGLDI